LASQGGRERKEENKKYFHLIQTPVNIGWQGFLFAEYKTTPLDFHNNSFILAKGNFLLLREC
jgi:hypothetical protein